jgi:hypothetical protein
MGVWIRGDLCARTMKSYLTKRIRHEMGNTASG